jgi:hypothetical protein
MTDEHKMPLPSKNRPLPWIVSDYFNVQDNSSRLVVYECATTADADFIVHAANYIIPCREIVRRLLEWHNGPIDKHVSLYDIANDAEKLWAKMREDQVDE